MENSQNYLKIELLCDAPIPRLGMEPKEMTSGDGRELLCHQGIIHNSHAEVTNYVSLQRAIIYYIFHKARQKAFKSFYHKEVIKIVWNKYLLPNLNII